MFGLGMGEIVLLCGIGLLLLGHRLPGVMRSLGESIPAFREGLAVETKNALPQDR